ncbi:MAG TPA: phospholipase D-like domain-containing protein [Steroidobacteraceae bacterium]|nr:phospholipase D-like domain-containing protein [Steroidobacteraceae bacterium]
MGQPGRRLPVKSVIVAAALLLWTATACWHAFKPLPEGAHVHGSTVAVDPASLHFLTDVTSANFLGERSAQPGIHAATLELVANAKDFLLLDYFLFNSQPGPLGELRYEAGIRPVASELGKALLALRAEQPGLPILVIVDPINSYYRRSRLPPELDALARGGIDVVITKLDPLRDSNPVYSTSWRLLLGWWLKATNRGRWPNVLDDAGPTVSFGALSRIPHFKANHRKVALTGDGAGSLVGIISSGNPHDASSAHSNVALQLGGEALRPLLRSELAIARMSGWQPRAANAALATLAQQLAQPSSQPSSNPAPEASGSDTTATILTEGAIRTALLEALAATGSDDAIDIAQFYFSDRQVITALLEAARRGASVRVVLDPNKDAFGFEKSGIPNREVGSELIAASDGAIHLRWYRTHGEQFHSKLAAIRRGDRLWLLLGSANFTRRNLGDYNLEADVAIDAPANSELAADVATWFEALWSNRPGAQEFTADAELYAEPSQARYWLYRFQEASGLSTF